VLADKNASSSQVSTSTQYPGGVTGAVATTNKILWGYPGLSWDEGMQKTPNLSNITQELVNTYSGLSQNNYMQFWVRGAYGFSPGAVKTSDFSDGKKVPAQIFLEWK
jgi:hypothetical protein